MRDAVINPNEGTMKSELDRDGVLKLRILRRAYARIVKGATAGLAVLVFSMGLLSVFDAPPSSAAVARVFRPVLANPQTFTVNSAGGGPVRLDVAPMYAVVNVPANIVGADTQMKVSSVTAIDPTLSTVVVQGVSIESPVALRFPIRVVINVGSLAGRSVVNLTPDGFLEPCSTCVQGSLAIADIARSGESVLVMDTAVLTALQQSSVGGSLVADPLYRKLEAMQAENTALAARGRPKRYAQIDFETEYAKILDGLVARDGVTPTTYTEFQDRARRLVNFLMRAEDIGSYGGPTHTKAIRRLELLSENWKNLLFLDYVFFVPRSVEELNQRGRRLLDTAAFIQNMQIAGFDISRTSLRNIQSEMQELVVRLIIRTNDAVLKPQIQATTNLGGPGNEGDFCPAARKVIDFQALVAAFNHRGSEIFDDLTAIGERMVDAYERAIPSGSLVTTSDIEKAQSFVRCGESLVLFYQKEPKLAETLTQAKAAIAKAVGTTTTTRAGGGTATTTTTIRAATTTSTTRVNTTTTTTRPVTTTTLANNGGSGGGGSLPQINCPAAAQVYDLRSPAGNRSPIDSKTGLLFLVVPGAANRLSSLAYPDGQNGGVTIDGEAVPALSATGSGLSKSAGGAVVWRAMRYPKGDLYIEVFSSTGTIPRSINGTIGGTSCTLTIQLPQ
jgi:hypothetical protein